MRFTINVTGEYDDYPIYCRMRLTSVNESDDVTVTHYHEYDYYYDYEYDYFHITSDTEIEFQINKRTTEIEIVGEYKFDIEYLYPYYDNGSWYEEIYSYEITEFHADDNVRAINCAITTETTYSSGDISLDGIESIGSSALHNATFDYEFIIPDGVTTIGSSAFSYATFNYALAIPSTVTSVGSYAFSDVTFNESFTVPNTITSIGTQAFGAKYAKPFTIPNQFTTIGTEFKGAKFNGGLTIPNTVTSIGNQAFSSSSFTGVLTIPNNVTSIGQQAFYNATFSDAFTMPSSATIGTKAFSNAKFNGGLTLYEGITIESETFSYAVIDGAFTMPSSATIGSNAFQYAKFNGTFTISIGNISFGTLVFKSATFNDTIIISDGATTIPSIFSQAVIKNSISIPSSVTTIENAAFQSTSFSETFTIPSTVTSIGDYAFYSATFSKAFTIPSTVTSIGTSAFSSAKFNGGLTLSEGLTTIGESAFYSVTFSQALTIPSTVTSIGDYAFYSVTFSQALTIPSTVTSIGDYAFINAKFNGGLTLPEGLTTIGYGMFSGATFTGMVTIPSTVTSIGVSAFSSAKFNGGLTLPEGLTTISAGMFDNATFTGMVTIPGTVTTIGNMAFRRAKLNGGLTLSEGLTTIGDNAFGSVTFSQALTIPSTVTSIGDNAFESTTFSQALTIPSAVTTIGDSAFKSAKLNGGLTLSEGLTTIGNNAFISVTFSQALTIPSTVTSIGDNAFSGAKFNDSLTLSEGLTTLGYRAFAATFSQALTIPSTVTSIGDSVFSGATFTGMVTIPSTVTSIGDNAFIGAKFNGGLTLSEGLTTIGDKAFYNGATFTGMVTIPSTVTSIGDYAFTNAKFNGGLTLSEGLTTLGANMFGAATFTGMVIIPSTVTNIPVSQYGGVFSSAKFNGGLTLSEGLTTIVKGMFYEATFSQALTIPSTVTSIGDSAFYNAKFNGGLTLSEGLTTIENVAFFGVTFASMVNIPSTVTSIGASAFNNVKPTTGTILKIYFKSIIPPTFGNTWAYMSSGKKFYLMVPYNAIDEYTTAFGNSPTTNTREIIASYNTNETTRNIFTFNTTNENESVYLDFKLNTQYSIYSEVIVQWNDESDDTLIVLNGTYPSGSAPYHVTHTYHTRGDHIVNVYVTIGTAIMDHCGDDSAVSYNLKDVTTAVNSSLILGHQALSNLTLDTVKLNNNNLLNISDISGPNTSQPFAYTTINNLKITNNVTSIPSGAFYGATFSNNIVIPSSVTSIDEYAFAYVTSDMIIIPDSITSIQSNTLYEACIGIIQFSSDDRESSTPPVLANDWAEFPASYISEHGAVIIAIPNESYSEVISATALDPENYEIKVRYYRDEAYSIPTTITFKATHVYETAYLNLSFASTTDYAKILVKWGNNAADTVVELTNASTTVSRQFYSNNDKREWQIQIYVLCNDVKLYNDDTTAAIYVGAAEKFGVSKISTGDGLVSIGCAAFKSFTNPYNSSYGANSYVPLTDILFGKDLRYIEDNAFYQAKFSQVSTSRCHIRFYNKYNLSIGDYAFFATTMDLHLGENISSIGNYAFRATTIYSYGTESDYGILHNLVIPDSVTNIGEGAFYDASIHNGIVIGRGITNIPCKAFDIRYVDQIMIGENVISIDEDAFSQESSLVSSVRELNFNSIVPPTLNENWLRSPYKVKYEIYVPNDAYINIIKATNIDPEKYTLFIDRPLLEVTPTVLRCEGDNASFLMLGATNHAQITVDWGDKTHLEEFMLSIYDPSAYTTHDVISHNYSISGDYNIKIYTNIGMSGFVGSNYDDAHETLFSSTIKSVELGDYVSFIADYAFKSSSVNSVSFGNSPIEIRRNAFAYVEFDDLVIPDSVSNIAQDAFSYASIRNISINARKISSGAFYKSRFDEVIIGNNVKTIETNAFNEVYIIKNSDIEQEHPECGTMYFETSITPTFGNAWYSGNYTYPTIVFAIPNEMRGAYEEIFESTLDNSPMSYSGYFVAVSRDNPNVSTFAYRTTTDEEDVFISLKSGYAKITIDWGDGVVTRSTRAINDSNTETIDIYNDTGEMFTHTYSATGDYVLQISVPVGDVYICSYDNDLESYQCAVSNNMTSIGINEGVLISESAFSGCTSLESVTINEGVTTIDDNAFSGCTSLTEANISAETIGDNAFSGCTALESVTLNEGITTIGDNAFENCTSLASIYIPQSVTTMGEDTFSGCTSITSIIVADSTITTITSGQYADCTSMTELNLPATLTSIEDNAFTNDNITKLTVYATTPPALTANSFADATVETIYVPAESLDAYKASAWNGIATIKPIKYVDPDEYDPDSIEDVPGDPTPEQNMSGEALKSIIKAYGKNLKYIKTENNTIAVNNPNTKGFHISSDDLIIRTFNGYDFVECKSYDPFFRKTYVSLIRVNDIRTFVIAENVNDTIDGFRC